MQAPRNWRNRVQRYRLSGVQLQDGTSSLISRPHGIEGYSQQTESIQAEPEANAEWSEGQTLLPVAIKQ